MFQLQISTANAAFHDGDTGEEVARILRDLAARVEAGRTSGTVFDVNGNRCGKWGYDLATRYEP
jgi:hypothetical protein